MNFGKWIVVSFVSAEPADDHVEGGIYVSPEFQLGQVYDGAADVMEDVILYRPVYVCSVPTSAATDLGNGHSPTMKGMASNRHDGQTPSPALGRAVISSASVEKTNGCSPVIKVKAYLMQLNCNFPLLNNLYCSKYFMWKSKLFN